MTARTPSPNGSSFSGTAPGADLVVDFLEFQAGGRAFGLADLSWSHYLGERMWLILEGWGYPYGG
jgi:hypothetical protein